MTVNNILIRCLFLCLFLLLNATFSQTDIVNDRPNIIAGLPFCGENHISGGSKRLILVSTLDGKLSALNMEDGGLESWSVTTGPGAMLSSSIHRLELTNNGQWVRMIPSLSGGLYKFNGDFIEAIPITADNLLRSSFKYSDDLVISGGRESRTYGVELGTGRVLYECSLGGCDNYTELDTPGDVVLVQRQTQTVRAVEPRTGIERWNFSVGQHEVKVSPGPLIDCHNTQDSSSDTILKVIVPEGLVCALSQSQPGRILWTHKFDSPVVSAWKVGKGQLEEVDLFGGTRPPSGPDQEPLPSSPALYVGMHQKQLYIQESVSMQQKIHELADGFRHHLLTDERRYPQIPWNPVLVSSTAVGLPSPKSQVKTSELTEPSTEDESHGTHPQTTAMSVLYASEYVNGNGYYLFSMSESSRDSGKDATLCPVNNSIENTTEEEIPVIESPDDIIFTQNQIFVVSLWFWWKEVFLISITTAVLVNILIRRRLDHTITFQSNELDLVKKSLRSYSSQDSGMSNISLPLQRSSESFESRFLTDFIPVHCLGKGGFGVVFEAKNKIDDCHYAIKRIPLPNSEESRERVMREVKALAKLDHQNIVRYFNAWLECPPPGWQEVQDQFWLSNRDCFSSNGEAFTVDLTGQVTPDSEKSFGHVINRNRLKLQPKSLWQPSQDLVSQNFVLPSNPEPPEDDNDSFIVFRSHSKEISETVSENNNEIKDIEVEDSQRLDSAITMASDTSMDTNTDVTDITKSESPKRPNKLVLKKSGKFADSSRMYLFIQMQLCKKKSLKDWLKDNIHNRSKPDVISIFDQIVQAVEYVHMQGLIHRDLKPSNIFFSPDGQVKVGDFGLVTAMAESPVDIWVSVEAELDAWADEKHTARVGTQLYMSPEQVSGKPYSYKVDIYSLGVILFELLVPFNTQMERIHTLTNLKANKYPKDFQSLFPQEYELLKLMLSHHPDERPTTYGIRARPPLECLSPSVSGSLAEWHFELPKRRTSSKSSSHSNSLDS